MPLLPFPGRLAALIPRQFSELAYILKYPALLSVTSLTKEKQIQIKSPGNGSDREPAPHAHLSKRKEKTPQL